MRLTRYFCLLLILSCGMAQVPEEALFAEALKPSGLTPDTARFDGDLMRFFVRNEFNCPAFEGYINDPYRLPFYALSLRNGLVASANDPAALVSLCARMIGDGTRRTLISDPLEKFTEKAKAPNALLDAIVQVYRATGVSLPLATRQKMTADLPQVPEALQQQAAFMIYVAVEARGWRNGALEGVGDLNQLYRQLTQSVAADEKQESEKSPSDAFWALYPAMQKVDLKQLFAGGHDLVLAAQRVANALQSADEATRKVLAKPFDFEVDTPWGRVALYGSENDLHPRLPYLLLIDTGGDDTYYGGAATLSLANAASVLIDLEGDDKYAPHAAALNKPVAEDPDRRNASGVAFGGAVLGYAVLIDGKGNDLYRTPTPGLGAARFGVGVLMDVAGNDLYDGYSDTQGAGYFGVGVLIDQSGEDRYLAFQNAQGFGGVKGFGLLLDKTGADQYIANDTQIDFPSPQSKEHNASLSQGMGYGRRADYLDGHSLGGGFGVLLDMAGDDRYTCGVFGQGAGYWSGVGMLIDLQGKDEYNGIWYVQGAAAHFAIGYLEDRTGDDHYSATMNMAQGAGHDFSIGFLYEAAGNDQYDAPSLALGGGNANGIGVFLDAQGDDKYSVRADSANLGRANPGDAGTLRERGLCLGLFIDWAGNDTYPEQLKFANNGGSWLIWSRRNEKPQESQVGVGIDK